MVVLLSKRNLHYYSDGEDDGGSVTNELRAKSSTTNITVLLGL